MDSFINDLSHLKHIRSINDNDYLIDMNFYEPGYFSDS